MKIGVFDPYLDDAGGGEKYMLTIAESLAKDHDVSIFWDERRDLELCKERFLLNLATVKLVQNIFSPKISKLKRLLESKKYDIIIFHSDGSIPFLLSRKTFLHIQQPLEHVSLSFFSKLKLVKVNKIFCNSKYTKKYIDKKFGIDSSVIYPPVVLHSVKVKKQNIVLHVGRFRPFDKAVGVKDFKKQEFMIDAFSQMIKQGLKDWKFVLAVSVQAEDRIAFEKLQEKVEELPIEFKINKSNMELWELYSQAKIYWHASGYGEDLEKHPEYAEHFGISTVEAMGAGAVPVVYNAGGQKESVTDGENGLTWDTLPELIENTLLLMNSKEILTELSENAKKEAKKFSKDIFIKNINDLILE